MVELAHNLVCLGWSQLMTIIPVYLLIVTSITLEAFFIKKIKIHPTTINNKVFISEYSDKKKNVPRAWDKEVVLLRI